MMELISTVSEDEDSDKGSGIRVETKCFHFRDWAQRKELSPHAGIEYTAKGVEESQENKDSWSFKKSCWVMTNMKMKGWLLVEITDLKTYSLLVKEGRGQN